MKKRRGYGASENEATGRSRSAEKAARWPSWSSIRAMGRSARSLIAGRRTMSGRERTCCWISGARRGHLPWVAVHHLF